MAKTKKVDLVGKTEDELAKDLVDLKKQQFNLRFQKSQGQLANTATIRQTRRQIARVKTAQAGLKNQEGAKAAPVAKKTTKKAAKAKA